MNTMVEQLPGVEAVEKEIVIRGSAARIFDALTRPEELMRWWTVSGSFSLTRAEADLRVGGKWMMHSVGGCGGANGTTVRGEYKVVEPPTRLEFTWIREEDGLETLVRWDLSEAEGVTRVRVRHDGFRNEEQRNRNSGWPKIAELLQAYVEQ